MSTIFTKGRHRRHLIDQVQLTRPPCRTRDRNGQSIATLHYSHGRKQSKISPTRLQLVYHDMRLVSLDIQPSFHPIDPLIPTGIAFYNIPKVLRVNVTNCLYVYCSTHLQFTLHIAGMCMAYHPRAKEPPVPHHRSQLRISSSYSRHHPTPVSPSL